MRKWQEICKQGLVEDRGFEFPSNMPNTIHVIYLIESCTIVTNWYFRFCHWEHHSPGSTAVVQESDSLQATRIRETRSMLPKVFKQLRNQLCALMETDGSPHVRFAAFSSYMTIMQVAVGVSEGMNVEGSGKEAPPLPPGSVLNDVHDLRKVRMPEVGLDHQRVIFGYLNDLFTQVQGSHTVLYDDEGQKV